MKRKRPIEPLTPDEANLLFRAIPRASPTAKRNRALISLLYFAGLRSQEAVSVHLRDIDFTHGRISVTRGKGARQRTVGLPEEALKHLAPWLRVRKTSSGDILCPVLYGPEAGRPLQTRYVREALARYARRAGISKRVHPHGLRHSHACRLADSGVPIHIIQRQLGHASIATTSLYLDVLAPNGVVDGVREGWA